MKFWIKAARGLAYLAMACYVFPGFANQFKGKSPEHDLFASVFLLFSALCMSGGVLVFLHLNRNEPQLVRLAGWLGFKTNPVDESQKK